MKNCTFRVDDARVFLIYDSLVSGNSVDNIYIHTAIVGSWFTRCGLQRTASSFRHHACINPMYIKNKVSHQHSCWYVSVCREIHHCPFIRVAGLSVFPTETKTWFQIRPLKNPGSESDLRKKNPDLDSKYQNIPLIILLYLIII